MMNFSDLVQGDNGLLVELRCHNAFHEQIFTDIINYLKEHLPDWKASGVLPVPDAVAIFALIDELAGGSRFWDEELALRAEDTALEIQDVLSELES